MQVVESLCHAPGDPTVLVSAHSSKLVRRQGEADVRGVTALTDAARWVATLVADNDGVQFQQVKSNYSLPMKTPLPMHWVNKTLEVLGTADREVLEQCKAEEHKVKHKAKLDESVDLIVAAVRERGEFKGSKTALVGVSGVRKQDGLTAVDEAVSRGDLVMAGTARNPIFQLPGSGSGSGCSGA